MHITQMRAKRRTSGTSDDKVLDEDASLFMTKRRKAVTQTMILKHSFQACGFIICVLTGIRLLWIWSDTVWNTSSTARIALLSSQKHDSGNIAPQKIYNSFHWLNGTRISNIDESSSFEGVQDVHDEQTYQTIRDGLLHISNLNEKEVSEIILKRTICHEQSRFVTWGQSYPRQQPLTSKVNDNPHNNNTTNIQEDNNEISWDQQVAQDDAIRLLYLTIHNHQHSPARKEALSRQYYGGIHSQTRQLNTTTTTTTSIVDIQDSSSIGPFDYECSDAKFLVTSLYQIGLGGTIRLYAITPLLMGLHTDRITLFQNQPSHYPKSFYKWALASCTREEEGSNVTTKQDHQCFFMPMSPCVITQEELNIAPKLTKKEYADAMKNGKFHGKYENERILIVPPYLASPFYTKREILPKGFRAKLHDKIMTLLFHHEQKKNETTGSSPASLSPPPPPPPPSSFYGTMVNQNRLELAMKVILSDNDDGYVLRIATMAYILRPNLKSQQQMDTIMSKLFHTTTAANHVSSTTTAFDPTKSLGVAIRASDKCFRSKNGTCMTFQDYMNVATEFSSSQPTTGAKQGESSGDGSDNENRHSIPTLLSHETLVITSESKSMLQEAATYQSNNLTKEEQPSTASFFRIIQNSQYDVAQGTGAPHNFYRKHGKDAKADDIMLSTMVAMKMQLMNTDVMGNRCSMFHKMIREFLEAGCGAAPMSTFTNLPSQQGQECMTRNNYVSN